VRSTGATNVVMAGGLAYANDLSGWLAHQPNDPAQQLAASLHLYSFNSCKDASCWTSQVEPVSKKVPLVTGELGEDDCLHGFIDGYMAWADARGISYLGWTWNTWDCRTGPALIADYAGTPTAFGEGLRAHLLTLH
jgi:endoglucanase